MIDPNELYHHGVKGMKWGVRRAAKRRNKYLDKTDRMAKIHKSNADTYSKIVKRLRSMSDSEYAKEFDDPDYLKAVGGSKKLKTAEINEYTRRSADSIYYAKNWTNAHDAIMNAPVDSLRSNRDYEKLINKYLNE